MSESGSTVSGRTPLLRSSSQSSETLTSEEAVDNGDDEPGPAVSVARGAIIVLSMAILIYLQGKLPFKE